MLHFRNHHRCISRTTITELPKAPSPCFRDHHLYQDFKIITAGTTADTPKKEGFSTDLLRGRAHILTIIMVYYPPPPAVSIPAVFQPSPQNRFQDQKQDDSIVKSSCDISRYVIQMIPDFPFIGILIFRFAYDIMPVGKR